MKKRESSEVLEDVLEWFSTKDIKEGNPDTLRESQANEKRA